LHALVINGRRRHEKGMEATGVASLVVVKIISDEESVYVREYVSDDDDSSS
jgi:hypothetical protein